MSNAKWPAHANQSSKAESDREEKHPDAKAEQKKADWLPWGQVLRFAMVGAINSSVSYVSFVLLHWWLGLYLLASVAAYGIGVMVSFFLNRHFVFQAQKRAGQVGAFIAVNGTSLLISTALLYVLVDGVGINVYVGQGVAMLSSMTVNYLGYRMVFR
ncbi:MULTISPECIES: GtrA family protein [unclassified Vibrio]|uniref:GtrA family protein n=1 Tax=Vibrio sp. HB236076 TaxID=3232307 RepID=A0AB39HGB2_9VIBR|nr:GtrA family protein [Vibrio sp. HB161653]MDP5254465.1 GtrA family protein [Vibrio sp. HB161653]